VKTARHAVLALGLLGGCRAESDDLGGGWEGALDCPGDVEGWADTFTVDVSMDVAAPETHAHATTLDLTLDWIRDDGAEFVQWARFSAVLQQRFGKGAQEIAVSGAACEDARSTLDDELEAEGCADVGPGLGTSAMRWDGADTLDWTGDCSGSLTRTAGLPGAD
jgi:hypothetical protein